VLDQTIQRAMEVGLGIQLLPAGYDVDDGTSLQRLCDDLLVGMTASGIAPHTREFLARLDGQRKL
jgi:hypothetical protein